MMHFKHTHDSMFITGRRGERISAVHGQGQDGSGPGRSKGRSEGQPKGTTSRRERWASPASHGTRVEEWVCSKREVTAAT